MLQGMQPLLLLHKAQLCLSALSLLQLQLTNIGRSHAGKAEPINLLITAHFELGIGCSCTLQIRLLLNHAYDEL
jgi:hypothetical protein